MGALHWRFYKSPERNAQMLYLAIRDITKNRVGRKRDGSVIYTYGRLQTHAVGLPLLLFFVLHCFAPYVKFQKTAGESFSAAVVITPSRPANPPK